MVGFLFLKSIPVQGQACESQAQSAGQDIGFGFWAGSQTSELQPMKDECVNGVADPIRMSDFWQWGTARWCEGPVRLPLSSLLNPLHELLFLLRAQLEVSVWWRHHFSRILGQNATDDRRALWMFENENALW